MWLLTTIGFYSVVQKPGDHLLTVRSRCAGDLDRLRQQFMPELGPTTLGQGTDYPARARISREAFSSGLAKLGEAITYSNFKDQVARESGKSRAHIYSKVWSELQAIEDEEPASIPHGEHHPLPGYSYGGVVFKDGKVLLREPANHFGGYVWTFPKGCPNPGELPEETALREVKEETGVIAKIVKRLPGTFAGSTGTTVCYLMEPLKETGKWESETAAVKWATWAEAEELIKMTKIAIGRERDLKILATAYGLLKLRAVGRP